MATEIVADKTEIAEWCNDAEWNALEGGRMTRGVINRMKSLDRALFGARAISQLLFDDYLSKVSVDGNPSQQKVGLHAAHIEGLRIAALELLNNADHLAQDLRNNEYDIFGLKQGKNRS